MAETIKKIQSDTNVQVITYFTTVDASSKDIYKANKNLVGTNGSESNSSAKIWDALQKNGKEAYAIKGKANVAVELLDVVDGSYCRRFALGNDYKFIPEEEIENVVKGKLITTKIVAPFPLRDKAVKNFINQATNYSGDSAYSNVFQTVEKRLDYYADITLKRTIDTLDTLSVKNNPLSSFPTQESQTGVVCGTLVARQKVLDENGERVLIPLSNVPIVIFNPSEEFPNYSSQDVDGNRVTLNLIQNTSPNDYADTASYVLDVGEEKAKKVLGKDVVGEQYAGIRPLLKSVESLFVPDQYKHSTITNDKGEFIIYDVPVGNQVILFEVDLLKQGMTKSEVALNFFPYSNEELPNVDNVPHFYFRQIPVGVGPCWGDFQTGYTQVNITANLDMRKWCTFYVPPISVGGANLDELALTGTFAPLTILAKDMTREGYPLTNEVVELKEIYSRVESQGLEWFNEFRISKPSITFNKNEYQAFKLPANLYDPNGNASKNTRRTKISSKNGVWLASYQMKMFYETSPSVYRATGFVRSALEGENSLVSSNHFDINRSSGFTSSSVTGEGENFSLNTFPYEQPWTINYPEPYSIPSAPRVLNETKNFGTQVEPRYLDGDLAGFYYGQEGATGYGLQNPLEGGDAIYNKFSQSVTNKRIYKYENNVSWHEEYSNGFRSSSHSQLFPNKTFSVENGESYQRLECGFAYWMRPEGWGRITHYGWGDIMLNSDIQPTSVLPPHLYPTSLSASMFRQGESLSIIMDSSARPVWINKGAIDFYRIIDETPQDLSSRQKPLSKRYVELNIDNVLRNNQKTTSQELKLKYGNQKDEMTISTGSLVEVTNNGAIKAFVSFNGVTKTLNPGETVTEIVIPQSKIRFSTNTQLNFVENYYEKCSYSFLFKNSEIKKAGEMIYGTLDTFNFEGGTATSIPQKYLVSTVVDCDGNVRLDGEGELDKCKNDFIKDGDYEINGLVFEKTRSDKVELRFKDAPVDTHCSDGGFGIRKIRPFK